MSLALEVYEVIGCMLKAQCEGRQPGVCVCVCVCVCARARARVRACVHLKSTCGSGGEERLYNTHRCCSVDAVSVLAGVMDGTHYIYEYQHSSLTCL